MKEVSYPAILYLEDGKYFKGWSFTSKWFSLGELVFNTGMTGYQEIMTDPSYANQMIVFTYPEIGNTGINKQDNESEKVYIKGIITKNLCDSPNNWRSNNSLKNHVLDLNIPHIFGIDTRSLTKYLRKYGVMRGCISSKILNIVKIKNIVHFKFSRMSDNLDLVNLVTTKESYCSKSQSNVFNIYSYINQQVDYKKKLLHIVVIDFGVKSSILSRLKIHGCKITVLSAFTRINEILKYKPNGILLSNGPGDPSYVAYAHTVVRQLIYVTNIPIFGICMGHQILSYALGGSTFKLKFGHRGLNHPSGINQSVEITSQNHGFAVNIDSLNHNCIMYRNLNDFTIAGIRHLHRPVFSVQYHPEASPGPHDSDYLFKAFIELILEVELYLSVLG